MCEYCFSYVDDRELILEQTKNQINARVSVDVGNFMNVIIDIPGYSMYEEFWFKVNYCPVCGRKLKGV